MTIDATRQVFPMASNLILSEISQRSLHTGLECLIRSLKPESASRMLASGETCAATWSLRACPGLELFF